MGTNSFFKHAPAAGTPNLNMENRALSSGAYQGRIAGGGANKDIAAAQALYREHGFKPQARGAAYPKGPKI